MRWHMGLGEHRPIISNVAQGLPREFYSPGIFGIVCFFSSFGLFVVVCLLSIFLEKIPIRYLRYTETCQKLVDAIKQKRGDRRRQGI